MISETEYEYAIEQKEKAQEVINQFHKEKQERFDLRMKENPIFADEELFYSASSLCPCGHGLAYPKGCGPHHYWDCSAILKGIADQNVVHTGQLPFACYEVKGENATYTTRGVFKPKQSE